MAQLARQTTVDKAKGETIIEMGERTASPTFSGSSTQNSKPIKPLQRAKTVNLSTDDYFSGPRDVTHHSRWPTFFQLHGSVMPQMIFPLVLVTVYSTIFTAVLNHWFKKPINLICAFSIAVKHRLRFEPYLDYEDLRPYAGHLDTFAKEAGRGVNLAEREYSKKKRLGEFLGLSFARSNPRKMIKRAQKPLGNLPLEILAHLQAYLDSIIDNGTLKAPCFHMQSVIHLQNLNDFLNGTDRILSTPLPAAYRIMITQITWVYILTLPPQLFKALKWFTIPATIIAAYIILGIALIGAEIENPFGYDVNDLPLDSFCEQIQDELALIMSRGKVTKEELYTQSDNMVLYPVSHAGYDEWVQRDQGNIREALASRPEYNFNRRRQAPVGMGPIGDKEREDV
ncbi:hypothetical protein FKW77_003222 [Venturia effusa]|uniref:Uncharacterized protein n=1 Tax=Venturia effusa TaxID=50376 RepID=A0A517LAN4_9PEZI|nr:hypothetical protein FKW77_003222 [Venturia effusa]